MSLEKLQFVYRKAQEYMEQYGLIEDGWTFRISNTKNIVGQCYHGRKEIVYSKWFLDEPDEQIVDTILHEIAHALVGPKHGHDWTWKLMAMKVGAEPNRIAENAKTAAKPNYLLRCVNDECTVKPSWSRFRLRWDAVRKMRCPYCHGPITPYRLQYK